MPPSESRGIGRHRSVRFTAEGVFSPSAENQAPVVPEGSSSLPQGSSSLRVDSATERQRSFGSLPGLPLIRRERSKSRLKEEEPEEDPVARRAKAIADMIKRSNSRIDPNASLRRATYDTPPPSKPAETPQWDHFLDKL